MKISLDTILKLSVGMDFSAFGREIGKVSEINGNKITVSILKGKEGYVEKYLSQVKGVKIIYGNHPLTNIFK